MTPLILILKAYIFDKCSTIPFDSIMKFLQAFYESITTFVSYLMEKSFQHFFWNIKINRFSSLTHIRWKWLHRDFLCAKTLIKTSSISLCKCVKISVNKSHQLSHTLMFVEKKLIISDINERGIFISTAWSTYWRIMEKNSLW